MCIRDRSMADALDAFIVAERAKEGGVPPKRRLGDWLRERWGGDTDTDSAGGKDVGEDLGHLVTFLDDGVDGVRSTRTERSVAETVDAPAAKPEPAPAAAPEPPRRPWWIAVAVVVVM